MSEGSTLNIRPGSAPGSYVLRGEMDLHTAPQVAEISARATGPGSVLTLEISGVSFIDSIGVWALVNLARSLEPGARLVLSNPGEAVKRTLELVDLSDTPGIVVDDPS